MTPDFLQELLRHSQNAPLKILVGRCAVPSIASMFWEGFVAAANCVKTLNFYTRDTLCFRDLTSFFPYLENLFYQPPTIDSSFDIPCMQPHLKALQIRIGRLDGFAMPGRFPELRWLELVYEPLIPWDPLLKALESLPNLQVLYLHLSNGRQSISEIRHPIITLPELKVLITYCDQILQLIHAPKLIHLHAENYLTRNDNGHFCGFDFSKITDIQLTIGKPSCFYIDGYDPGAGCSFYYENVSSIFDTSPVLYPNKFKILLENLTPYENQDTSIGGPRTSLSVFAACLKKTINLVELHLGGDDPPWHFWNCAELDSLFKVLKCATSIRMLVITWGLSFPTLCDILSDGTIFPHLEKITYYTIEENLRDLSDIRLLQKLMQERFTKGRKPLEIALQDFPPVHPELLEEIGRLGIQLTQPKELRSRKDGINNYLFLLEHAILVR